jgi:hydrogenase maturation factor
VTGPQPELWAHSECDPELGCITCGDVAVEMRVSQVDRDRGLALCADEAGRRQTVEVALVQPVAVGEGLLVHAGTAIAKLETETVGA